jgi:hypothetical protein
MEKDNNYYKIKYFKYKAKYFKKLDRVSQLYDTKRTDMRKTIEGSFLRDDIDNIINTQMYHAEGGANGKKGNIQMDKEVKKLVPEVNKDFLDLYFAVKLGLHYYHDMNGMEEMGPKDVAMTFLKLAKMKINNELHKNNILVSNIVDGINEGKTKGKKETNKNLIKYIGVFDKMFKKHKKNNDIQAFKKEIITLINKLMDAEHQVYIGLQLD